MLRSEEEYGSAVLGRLPFRLLLKTLTLVLFAASAGRLEAQRAGSLYSITPCRVFDSRQPAYAPALSSGSIRTVAVTGKCGIPATAKAISGNLTVAFAGVGGVLRVFRGDGAPGTPATLTFQAGETLANNLVVALAANGAGTVGLQATLGGSGAVHAILDVNGYFSTDAPASADGADLYPLDGCRAFDSRLEGGPLTAGLHSFSVRERCDLPSEAEVAVLNVTAISASAGGWLSVIPYNATPLVSTVNFNAGEPGLPNGAIVPLTARSGEDLTVQVAGGPVHVTIDVLGYFKPVLQGIGDEDTANPTRWGFWEHTLRSRQDYTAGNGNPYRDIVLAVTYKRISASASCSDSPPLPSDCQTTNNNCFRSLGFWHGRPGQSDKDRFTIRSTFPGGKWCWWTTCSGTTGGMTCDAAHETPITVGGVKKGLVDRGTIVVSTSAANALSGRGMPKVDGRRLIHDNGANFAGLGDTAWEAPIDILHGIGRANWSPFIADRATKGFSTVLLAPAPQYADTNAPEGFRQFPSSACSPASTVIPHNCSYWDDAYWNSFDARIQIANNRGLVPIVAGLIDPIDRGGERINATTVRKYPNLNDAVIFARNLAARLAGNLVMFSPGFDDMIGDPLEGGGTVLDSMRAVGNALHYDSTTNPPPIPPAVRRHLITNQLAGGSDVSDYDLFHSEDWLSFQGFQSGHGGNQDSPCNGLSQYATAMCRARHLSLRFHCVGADTGDSECTGIDHPSSPVKPAMNTEGPYELFNDGDPGEGPPGTLYVFPDNRRGVRQAAYLSALSGAFGFSIGVEGIYQWDQPGIYRDGVVIANNESFSDNDLVRLATHLRNGPWVELKPRPSVLAPEPDGDQTKKRVIAEASGYVLGYLPHGRDNLTIKRVGITGLTSCSGWSRTWFDPSGQELSATGTCTQTGTVDSGTLTFPKPSNRCPASNQDRFNFCDWVLKLERNATASGSSSNASAVPSSEKNQRAKEATLQDANDLEVWSAPDAETATSGIWAQLLDKEGTPIGAEFEAAAPGETIQKLPRAARDSAGGFLVVWEAEGLDGSLDGIYGRRYDSNGGVLGDRFRINSFTLGDQASPAATADAFDGLVVVWTSHEQDGDQGGIYGQRLAADGSFVGSEFPVNETTAGHQFLPQVMADAKGNFVVAWTSVGQDGSGEGVYARRFARTGESLGPELQVNTITEGDQRLVSLTVDTEGNFTIQWDGASATGLPLGLFQQSFDADGNRVGGETQVVFP